MFVLSFEHLHIFLFALAVITWVAYFLKLGNAKQNTLVIFMFLMFSPLWIMYYCGMVINIDSVRHLLLLTIGVTVAHMIK